MARKSKLAELGLEKEASEIRKEGHGWEVTAQILNERHHDLIYDTFGEPLSHMAIKRGIQGYDKKNLTQIIEKGEEDIIEVMQSEYNDAILKIIKSLHRLEKDFKKVRKIAEESGNVNDMVKANLAELKRFEEIRKHWESLQQFTIRQVSNIGDINLKKDKEVKVLMLNFSNELMDIEKDLCDECREGYLKRIEALMTKIANDN